MKKKLSFLLLLNACLGCGFAAPVLNSEIPLSVRHIDTWRVGQRLVRVIQHNTEMQPQLEIELIKIPGVQLVQKKVVKKISIEVGGRPRELIFSDASAIFINDVNIEEGIITFKVEFFTKESGGYFLSKCELDANNNKLANYYCKVESLELK